MSWKIRDRLRRLYDQEELIGPRPSGGGRRFVIAFANTYHLAMSNLGFQTVYGLMADFPGLDCQRAFRPDDDMIEEHRRTGTPWLTLEAQEPAADAEVIAFSLPFENDYLNLVRLLDLAGLPAASADRRPGDPLIVAGGAAPSLNPEPLALIADLIVVGEAEPIMAPLLNACLDSEDLDRRDRLLDIATRVDGVYAPALYEEVFENGRFAGHRPLDGRLPGRIKRVFVPELVQPAASRIISRETEFDNRSLIEISRGCIRNCRFCAAGQIGKPPRRVDHADLVRSVESAAANVGQVGLIGAAVSDLPGIEELILAGAKEGAKMSVASLRADTLTQTLACLLVGSGAQTVTMAPEAGSERMRRVINKGLDEDSILEAAVIALDAGFRNIKLYFMIGLPFEQDEDVVAISELVRKISRHLDQASVTGRKPRLITLSAAGFTPKPHTAFQWAAMNREKELKRKVKLLRKSLKGLKKVRLNTDRPKWAVLEGLLSRGDRSVSQLLIDSLDHNGDLWAAAEATDFDWSSLVHRERGRDEPFPWEIVDPGPTREYFLREWGRAKEAKQSPTCSPSCTQCGVCPV